jgi:hypothetical protein
LLQGKLSGNGVKEKLPTIAVVAYYDSFGVAPVSNIYHADMLARQHKLDMFTSYERVESSIYLRQINLPISIIALITLSEPVMRDFRLLPWCEIFTLLGCYAAQICS